MKPVSGVGHVDSLCAYGEDKDWTFASETLFGKRPMRPNKPADQVPPAAKKADIVKQIGWPTFRHTYSTLLKDNGEDVKGGTGTDASRQHHDTTAMNIYTHALTPAKRGRRARQPLCSSAVRHNRSWCS
ncbi:hypothetical protein [Edaphobacter sp. 12200R-103]|jgi:integrase|uniref:hypothetical protein n=1 Tax=Edaphobacter sp. 12200R-103 TaxID=2703788 RepID=UPI001EE410F0|nr:hypothetical protein [Edaphobacter sp. 12200R-103]